MAMKSPGLSRVATAAAMMCVALGAALVGAVSPAGAATNLCQKVTAAEVSAALGVKVIKPSTVINGSVTVCWFQVGSIPNSIYVRSAIGAGSAVFASDRSQSKTQGEHPVTDHHFAPYSAFSTSLGSASYGYTYGVVVLKKKNELSVGASHVSLAKVEALAKKVLPLL